MPLLAWSKGLGRKRLLGNGVQMSLKSIQTMK